jgi:allantoate deiminase
VRRDPVGNIIGRRAGADANLPAIAIGSHIDTVLNGGRYDGALGVLGGIEVCQALHEDGVQTRHPLEVISFIEEESTRWASAMLGSNFMAGRITAGMLGATDRQGVSIAEGLAEAGYDPAAFAEAARPGNEFRCYIELHIEQGAVLESLNLPVGVVTGIAGPLFLFLRLTGRTDHAGATPMNLRRDTLVAAAELVLAARDAALAASPTAVATVGRLEVKPGATNAIPGEVFMTFDLRDIVEAQRDRLEASVRSAIQRVTREAGLISVLEEPSRHPPVPLPEHMVEAVATACAAAGYPVHRLPSGAGHDAQVMASITPTAMIFVRSRDGVSHSPHEYSQPGDILAGVEVLHRTVLELDRG